MKRLCRLALAPALAFAAGALGAQSPNYGLAISMGIPMGEFRETTYPPTTSVPVVQVEGYDIGIGGQFTMSMPLQKNLAFRFGISGMETEGTNTAAGYDTITLKHTLFSISGEIQVFFDDAYWHRGPYVVGGVSGDFERFERSFDYYYWGVSDVTRKNRLGGMVGIGHTFGGGGGLKFMLEASLHSTLTGKNPELDEPPASDFLKIVFGFVF